MTILLRLGLIFGALIAPGLLTVYLAREASPSPERDPSAEATVLSAMTIALVIVSLEFFALSVLSLAFDGHRLWGGLTIAELVSDDPWAAIQSRPEQVAPIASTEYLTHLAFLAATGWFNPARSLLKRRAAAQGLRESHPFVDAVREAPAEFGTEIVYASAVLRDGQTYTGTLQSVSFRPLNDGSRELFLQSVERVVGGQRDALGPEGALSGLVLNTRDVVAIELAYADAPHEGEPTAVPAEAN